MVEKLCNKCNQVKNIELFSKNKTKKDGRQTLCKTCNKVHIDKWYQNHKEIVKNRSKIRNNKMSLPIKRYILDYLKTHPCVVCGETDILVLEFDHLKDKKYNISNMIANKHRLESVQEEISKCQVLCSNCHKRKTAKDFGYYKYLSQ